MKRLKRIAAVLLLMCLCVAGISTTAYAADGTITFTDLETAVGDTFTVRCRISSSGSNIGNVTLKMSYDTSFIQFISGDGVTQETAGQLIYQGSGGGAELQFEMEFQALQEGQMRMTLDEAEVLTESGESIDCELGYSDVTIGEGDPSKIENLTTGPTVDVDGEQYTLSEDFKTADIPSGFSPGTITYEGTAYQGAVFDSGDMKLGYLVNSAGTGKFYVYNESSSEFSAFEYVTISDKSFIILLQEDESLSIPSQYAKQTLTVNSHEFPAWQDTKNTDYYLLYALNQEGEKLIYRYDVVDGTYQRFSNSESTEVDEPIEEESSGLFGSVSDYLKNHIDQFLIGVGMLLVLGLVFIILLGVKLHNRNTELDEVYDQLDEYSEPKNKAIGKSRTLQSMKAESKPQDDRDEEDDYYEEDDYEDDFLEDDKYEDIEELRFQNILSEKTEPKGTEPRAKDYDEYKDLELDQTGDISVNKKVNKKKKKVELKDDYDIEIIDL